MSAIRLETHCAGSGDGCSRLAIVVNGARLRLTVRDEQRDEVLALVAAAVLAEREACANACEETTRGHHGAGVGRDCATAIRARGEKAK